MSELPVFRQLQEFIGEHTAYEPRRNGQKPITVNALTLRIVERIRNRGHCATRLQSTDTHRNDLKKSVPSQLRPGLPDIGLLPTR